MLEGAPILAWVIFSACFVVLWWVDLFVHRGERADSRRTAVIWTIVWIVAGLAFAGYVWWRMGSAHAVDYVGAYLIEKSLSVDNLFVFLVVFRMLHIPKAEQRRVLTWGIVGALVLRGLFIFAGAAAIQKYEWVETLFGLLLLWAAWRTFREDPTEEKENRAVTWLSRHLPLTSRLYGHRFFVKVDGRWMATPLLIALLALELTDVLFAIDSVPAAFAISREPFIVYTSNAFAILGLRALYIVLAHTLEEMVYLHYGLSFVLGFAAIKLMFHEWLAIPSWLSILIIASAIGLSVFASLRHRDAGAPRRPESDTGRAA